MVDVESTNAKLIECQKHFVMTSTKYDRATAEQTLIKCNNYNETTIVIILTGFNAQQEAKQGLADNNGFIRPALKQNTDHQYLS
ncbi:MAG: hypothetical protein ACTS77_04135 [Arsenophonus sp. NC-TX2-MAG3]